MGHPFTFIAIKTFSYHDFHTNMKIIRSFGTMLSPDHLWRRISKSVSCYAFFE